MQLLKYVALQIISIGKCKEDLNLIRNFSVYVTSVLQIVGPVTHSWLDQYKQVTGCEKVGMLF
jgi:hypothetical protein